MVKHAADTSPDGHENMVADGADDTSFGRRPRTWAVLTPGIVAALLGAYVLSLPHALTGIHGSAARGKGYDEGVYFGAAIRLINGGLPYRDFLLPQPPGIAVLFAPFALLGELMGEPAGLVVTRIVTLVVGAANASLVALAVRHRGPAAMLTAGIIFSLFPLAVAATNSLMLEAYVVLFLLVGLNLAFTAGRLAHPRRLLIAGACFGLACTVKLTAAPALLAAVVVIAVKHRRAVLPFAVGVAAPIAAIFLPFFAAAPRAFLSAVFEAQTMRSTTVAEASALHRLSEIFGLSAFPFFRDSGGLVIAVAVAFVAWLAYCLKSRHSDFTTCDWLIVVATVVVTVAAFASRQFPEHYAYIPFAWIAMTVAVIVAPSDTPDSWPAIRQWPARMTATVAGLAALAAVVFILDVRYAREFMAGSFDVSATLREAIPAGACVWTDLTTTTIMADRFTSTDPDCPLMIDPFGTWFAETGGRQPYQGRYPEPFVVGSGRTLSATDYVVMVAPHTSYIPWTRELEHWFLTDFAEVVRTDNVVVYQHQKRTPPPASIPSIAAQEANDLVDLGIKAEQSGDTAGAFAKYLEAIQKDPNNKFAHFDAGHVYQSRGEDAQAETEYLAALQIDPNFVEALFNLGVLKAGSDPASAMDFYRRVLTVAPDHPVANFNLGVLMVHNDDQSGLDLIQKGITLQPNLAGAVPPDIHLG